MKKIIRLLLIAFISLSPFLCLSDITQAKGGGGGRGSGGHSSYKSSGSGSKAIKVKSYYRKDGTYVPSHNRSDPSPKGSSITLNKSSKSSTLSSTSGIKRDSERHIERSSTAKKEFMKKTGIQMVGLDML